MKSKWYEYKSEAVKLRKQGLSIREIEKLLKIPRSTLSGWLRPVELDHNQITRLEERRRQGLIKARTEAAHWHNKQKELRLSAAEESATNTLKKLEISDSLVDLALSMLYLGEGKKNNSTAIGSSDPLILKFFLTVLIKNYGVDPTKIRCDLHLRMDQDITDIKEYWSSQLGIDSSVFKSVFFDKRTEGKDTYPSYMGVCVIDCSNIAVQRKLKYLYTQFCNKVINDWAISSVG